MSNNKVGYRRPPKHSRFRRGLSGNPKGRPKGARNLHTLIADELRKKIVVIEGGRRKRITKGVAIAKRVVRDALQGDSHATKIVLDEMRRSKCNQPQGTEKEGFYIPPGGATFTLNFGAERDEPLKIIDSREETEEPDDG